MADLLFCAKRLDWDAPVTEVLTLENDVLSEEWIVRTPYLTDSRYSSLKNRQLRIRHLNPISFPNQRREEFKDYIHLVAREWWHGQMHSRFAARIVCLFCGVVGFGMLSISTLDIAQAVVRDIFG